MLTEIQGTKTGDQSFADPSFKEATDPRSPIPDPEVAIKVENLTKIYKLYNSPQDRLKESLHPLRKKYHHDFYALNDVSFEVKKGETVGIIGRNGSGKSTLLKMITGVLTPSCGSVTVDGRISALLELGAGFNPELTGIENVYFNGTLMGYSKEEMDAKLADILAFADIGEFVYQPVKTYSSGMFVRLAFAAAISVDPEILIIDEALSVGDSVFQQKCFNKFSSFQEQGKTILFVSHSIESIIRYCGRAIVLNNGAIITEATAKEAADVYKKILVSCYREEKSSAIEALTRPKPTTFYRDFFAPNPNASDYGNKKAEIIDYGLLDAKGEPTSKLYFDEYFSIIMQVKFNEGIADPIFAYTIRDLKGLELTGTNTVIADINTGQYNEDDYVTVNFQQKMNLRAGSYSLCLGCTGYLGDDFIVYNRLYDITLFDVLSDSQSFSVGFFDLHSQIEISV